MNIRCFKRGNLYCIWDDNLLGKDVVVADSLNSLYEKLEMDEIPVYRKRAQKNVWSLAKHMNMLNYAK